MGDEMRERERERERASEPEHAVMQCLKIY